MYLNFLRDSKYRKNAKISSLVKFMIFRFPLQSRKSVRKLFWQRFRLPIDFVSYDRCFSHSRKVSRNDFLDVEYLEISGLKIWKYQNICKISKNMRHPQLRIFVCTSALLTRISSPSLMKFEDTLIFHSTDYIIFHLWVLFCSTFCILTNIFLTKTTR